MHHCRDNYSSTESEIPEPEFVFSLFPFRNWRFLPFLGKTMTDPTCLMQSHFFHPIRICVMRIISKLVHLCCYTVVPPKGSCMRDTRICNFHFSQELYTLLIWRPDILTSRWLTQRNRWISLLSFGQPMLTVEWILLCNFGSLSLQWHIICGCRRLQENISECPVYLQNAFITNVLSVQTWN